MHSLRLRGRSKSGSGETLTAPVGHDPFAPPPVPSIPDTYRTGGAGGASMPPARAESGLLSPIAIQSEVGAGPRQPSAVFVPQLPGAGETAGHRAQHLELLSRPLHQSAMGRTIVRCLTLPWITAPSGLAVCEVPEDPSWDVEAIAEAVNFLTCGAQAYAAPYARLLGIKDVGQLNRMLSRSGLTTVAPMSTPSPWMPMMTRQPPDFVQEGFGKTHKRAMPSLASTIQSQSSSGQSAVSPPLTRSVSPGIALDKPTRTMEQMMLQLREAPRGSKQAQDLARALILAEQERFKRTGVELRAGAFSQRLSGAMASIGEAALRDEPFEYDTHGHGHTSPPRASEDNASLPRSNSPRI